MLKVYNTLSGKKEEFKPGSGKIRMYVCGPTVYDLSHLGHARSAVAFDVIYRYLKYKFKDYKVIYTRNYTDIDDKIINRANREGVVSQEIANRYINAFDEDMQALGIELPTHRPKATETIPEIISVIQTLLEKGYAYVIDGDVYYSVRKFEGYGRLSGKKIEELEAGARVEVNERKKDPLDFALWKASKPGEPQWESPWGRGRPGWHIECSAMSQKFLGETLDIHGGGKDLIFPHHENEIAQSEAATGRPFVKYWLHNGFVTINQEKMSKSLGNFFTIREILDKFMPPDYRLATSEALRYFFLSTHYRSPIDFSDEGLWAAKEGLQNFYELFKKLKEQGSAIEKDRDNLISLLKDYKVRFEAAMDDDFNTAAALAELQKLRREINPCLERGISRRASGDIQGFFSKLGNILGLFSIPPDKWPFTIDLRAVLSGTASGTATLSVGVRLSEEEIDALIKKREEARRRNDYKRGDEIREQLRRAGIIIEDRPDGTTRVKR